MIQTQLIDHRTGSREYGIQGQTAIIDHPEHGRLLVVDGYGGEDQLRGGTVRWEHGAVYRLQPGDTLAGLEAEPWNDGCTMLQAVQQGLDDSRPCLDWSGHAVEALARQAGLVE